MSMFQRTPQTGEIPADDHQLEVIRAVLDGYGAVDDGDRFGYLSRLGFAGITSLNPVKRHASGHLTLGDASRLLRVLARESTIRSTPRLERDHLVPRPDAHKFPVAERFVVSPGLRPVKLPSEDTAEDLVHAGEDLQDLHAAEIVQPRADPREPGPSAGDPPSPPLSGTDPLPTILIDRRPSPPDAAAHKPDPHAPPSPLDEDIPF